MNKRNQELLDKYLADMKLQGRSRNTLWTYSSRISRFFEYLGEIEVTDVSRQDIRDFLTELQGEDLKTSTVGAFVVALRSFGAWLREELWEQGWRDVFSTIHIPNVPKRSPVVVSKAVVGDVMTDMKGKTGAIDRRDYAMFCLTYETALRASEVASLDIEDINLKDGIVTVKSGKGDKSRSSFFTERTRKALEEWFSVRPQFQEHESGALFIGKGSDRMSRKGVWQCIRRVSDDVTEKTVTPHTLRRSRATHLVEQGVDVFLVQRMMGHSSPETTTEVYVNTNPKRLKQMLDEQTNEKGEAR